MRAPHPAKEVNIDFYWLKGKEIRSKKMRFESFCTVFQAELYTVYQAPELLRREKQTAAAVLSDSRSALDLIKNSVTFYPLAFEIRRNIAKLAEEVKSNCTG